MVEYRRATWDDLERLWDYQIAENPGDSRYLRWKKQFIEDNLNGSAATFVVVMNEVPIGECTLLLSPDCRAVRGRTDLCDGRHTANINALRIRKEYEGLGYISQLMTVVEKYARDLEISHLTIGVEAAQTRNLGIYLHWGYDEFVMSETEDDALVLYYRKRL